MFIVINFSKLQERSKKLVKNISMTLLTHIADIAIGIYIVPILISSLSEYTYGVWLVLISFVTWFRFADIGIGNAMRNSLTKALALDNTDKARKLVSSAYVLMISVGGLLIAIFVFIFPLLNWYELMNVEKDLVNQLPISVAITFLTFVTMMVVKLIISTMHALQDSFIAALVQLISRLLTLSAVILFSSTGNVSLFSLSILFNCIPLSLFVIASIILFNTKYNSFAPSLSHFDLRVTRQLVKIGLPFLAVQISGILIYSTDRIMIAKLFSPADVVPYHIVHKYYSVLLMLATTVNAPLWSAYADATARSDHKWNNKAIKMCNIITIIIVIMGIIMYIAQKYIIGLWVGNEIVIPTSLSFVMLIYTFLRTWGYPYVTYINGNSKVFLQSKLLMIGALINIPLSILFARSILGLSGIMVATIISTIYIPVVAPIQYRKLTTGKAKGVWNR